MPTYPYNTLEGHSPQPSYGYSSRSSLPVIPSPSDSRRLLPLTISSLGGDRWQQSDYGMPTAHGYSNNIRLPTTSYPTTDVTYPSSQSRKSYLDPEPTLSTIITSSMPAYIPCSICMVSISTSHHQSTTTYHHKVCAHAPRADGSAISDNPNRWNVLSNRYHVSVAPMSNPATSLQSAPPLIHEKSPYSCVPLPPLSRFHVAINWLLNGGTTERIDYDVCMHPSTAKKLHGWGGDSQWQTEAAANPSLGSLTIRLALVERPIVIFPANADHGIVTIYDVLLAVHCALYTSVTDDHCRRHGQDAELLPVDNSALHFGRNKTCRYTGGMELEGCYKWVGLTPSPIERDVWILLTR